MPITAKKHKKANIFETNTISVEKEVLNVDDVIETANHFRCIDMIIDNAKATLTEKFIKELQLVLKNGTSDSRKEWFAVGDYKKVPNVWIIFGLNIRV